VRLIDRIRLGRRAARLAPAVAIAGGAVLAVIIEANPKATIFAALALGAACFYLPWLYERPLMAELRRRGSALCPGCGYLLYDRPDDLCPECGRRYTIEQATAEWRTLARQWPGDCRGHVQLLCKRCGHDIRGFTTCPRCRAPRGKRAPPRR
jgi:RNA polymerase subunit RPABC4/transcription elongation factor Spt4